MKQGLYESSTSDAGQYGSRTFLSDRYRRIDNYDIAKTALLSSSLQFFHITEANADRRIHDDRHIEFYKRL